MIKNFLRNTFFPLLLLTILGSSSDQWITSLMESELLSPQGASGWIWFYGLLSLTLNLLYPLLTTLVVLSGLQGQKIIPFIRQFSEAAVIEQMRAWGKSMAWAFLLIIPGLIRLLGYLLVPFVVCLNPDYQRGQIDALSESRKIFRRSPWKITFLFVLIAGVVPTLMTSFDEYKVLWKTPAPAFALCVVEMLLNICFIWGLWTLYRKGSTDEPAISMERH